jgi:ubiquinone/menaquinone biosynthesis C-methylase UbiE
MISDEAKELRKLWSGFWSSRVLITANNLEIFDHLKRPISAADVAEEAGTAERATELLLDALSGLGLVLKERGRYKNSALAARFLVQGAPYYQGDIIRHADTLWRSWSELDDVVRTGRPIRRWDNHQSFILGMHNLASLKVKKVLRAVNLKGVRTALDFGGGPGTYAMEMARKGVTVTLFDTPDTIKIAKRVARGRKGMRFLEGDFLVDDIGRCYDLIFISQIFHSYSEEENLSLLSKCHAALNARGRVAVHDFLLDEDRTRPLSGALFSMNMLVNTEGGRCYSPSEMKGWFLKSGFKNIREKPLGDTVVVEGMTDATLPLGRGRCGSGKKRAVSL